MVNGPSAVSVAGFPVLAIVASLLCGSGLHCTLLVLQFTSCTRGVFVCSLHLLQFIPLLLVLFFYFFVISSIYMAVLLVLILVLITVAFVLLHDGELLQN